MNKIRLVLMGILKVCNKVLVEISVLLMKIWKKCISPFFGENCRFYPSCSEYGIQALQKHGFIRGSLLSAKRICRCNSLFEGGIDPVPELKEKVVKFCKCSN